MIHSRLLLFLAFLLMVNAAAFTQNSDEIISGKWVGYYTNLGKNYPLELNLEYDGEKITGTSVNGESPNEFVYSIEGSFKNSVLKYKGKEVLIKNSDGCLSTNTLTLIQVDENTYLLEGKWKCWVSGRINVTKKVLPEQVEISEQRDVYTEEFIKGMEKRSYHALFVCIDNYQNEEIESLSNPISDGIELKNTLITYYNFEPENISFLKNPTRQDIIDQLDILSESLNDYDNLMIFFAGHGMWDEDLKQGYWLPADAKLSSKGQWISNATIRDYVRSINTKHTLLIADACFSGGILKERSASISGKALVSLYNLPSRKAVTSGTLTTVPDESVFSYYLVKNLKENSEKVLPADQLFSRMKVAVINNSPNNQIPQYGAIHQAGDEGGDFIFIKRN